MGRLGKSLALMLILALVTSLLTLQAETVKAQTKTIVVPDHYPIIQSAIDNAKAGDTVFVKNGIYNETIFINKTISLIGQDRNLTIVDAQKSYEPAISIKGNNITVANLTVGNSDYNHPIGYKYWTPSYGEATGIRVLYISNDVKIINNTVIACPQVGIQLDFSKHNLVADNIIIGSIFGVEVHCVYSTIENNILAIANNTLATPQEVYIPYNIIITGDDEIPSGRTWFINESNTIKDNQMINLTSAPTPFPSIQPPISPTPAFQVHRTNLVLIIAALLTLTLILFMVVKRVRNELPKEMPVTETAGMNPA